ncbi:hypothetical protein MK079_05585, partial [Candidatus Gracilibacteria bacterium]|nr:hypothetical protein [Candidatus Gracilibacteria bacterium]
MKRNTENNFIQLMNTITDIRAIYIVIGNTLVRAGRIVFQLFLNIFIWKHTGGDLQVVALFNLVYLLFHTVSFLSVAFLVKAGYGKWLNLTALLGYTLVYLMVIILGNNSLEYIYWIAAAIGVFNGMYWITYHYHHFFVTNFANRGNYEGIKKSLAIITSVVVPPLVGTIIA